VIICELNRYAIKTTKNKLKESEPTKPILIELYRGSEFRTSTKQIGWEDGSLFDRMHSLKDLIEHQIVPFKLRYLNYD